MGRHLSLTASDNHQLGAYRADPKSAPKGGIVVAQESVGVNHHIRNVCDRLAEEGYAAVAPALFDRFERDFETGYSPDEVAHARKYLGQIDWDAMLRDMDAGVKELKNAGPVGVVGFCMGGSVAYLCATRLKGLSASVCYYGGQIVKFADEKPRCPVQMHFGEKDSGIALSDVETIRGKRPESEIHVYPGAQHGFHCDERASYDAASARVAWDRTLGFLSASLALT